MSAGKVEGYSDTPVIPGSVWKVHDPSRPQPKVVTPGSFSTQEQPGKPPSDAVVLFDGKSASRWQAQSGGPFPWKLENGYMEVIPKTGQIVTTEHFGDCQLHVEWAEPTVIKGQGQGRGNSGVFLMNMYEIQVLDCHENQTYPDGTTGAIYGEYPPLVNACRKPGEWQTYDILWVAPRFDGERLVSPAVLTVFQNGICIHCNRKLFGPTTHRKSLPYTAHPPVGPLGLQDHGDLVRYRNIWYRPIAGHDEG